jgi:hypothetical protein
LLLKQWKRQLEWDLKGLKEAELPPEEWNKVQEGMLDYDSGKVLS